MELAEVRYFTGWDELAGLLQVEDFGLEFEGLVQGDGSEEGGAGWDVEVDLAFLLQG
jgi:hypothetical protein